MRVLLNGGSHSDLPAIWHLKNAGHEIITSGNKPSERGHRVSHQYVGADFSDPDAVRQVIRDTKPDILLPSCNDYSYLTACALAEEFGFKGYDPVETARKLHLKDSFRGICAKLGIPAPRHKSFAIPSPNYEHDLRYPVLVKSTDLTGGKGIFRCRNGDEFRSAANAIRGASRRPVMVAEEIFEGTLHSFSTFIRRQKVVFFYCDKEYLYPGSFLVQSSLGPTKISDKIARELVDAVESLAEAYRLVDGLMHVQFMTDGHAMTLIEVTRRCPGDMYAVPVDMLFGQAFYTQAQLSGYLGEPLPDMHVGLNDLRDDMYVSRACIMTKPGTTRIDEISLDKVLEPSLVRLEHYTDLPSEVRSPATEKFGVAFLQFDNFSSGDRLLQRFMELDQVI